MPTQNTQGAPAPVQSNFPQNPPTNGKGSIVSLAGDPINAKMVEVGTTLIVGQAKKTGNLSAELFALMRECEDIHVIKGTLSAAESRAIKAIADEFPEEKVATLADVARMYGSKQLSYVTVKSNFLRYIDKEDDLTRGLQSWYDWQEKHMGEPKKILADNFLNLWSGRYAPKDNRHAGSGVTDYLRDVRAAEAGIASLEAEKKRAAREAAKAGTTANDGGSSTQQGIASGSRQRPNEPPLPEPLQEAMVKLINMVRLAHRVTGTDFAVSCLDKANAELMAEMARVNNRTMEAARTRPNAAVAEAQRTAHEPTPEVSDLPEVPDDGEMTDEDNKNIEALAPDDEAPVPSPSAQEGARQAG